MDDAIKINRRFWDERARIHGQDAYYDVEAFLHGESTLTERELAQVDGAVGDVRGIDLLHMQCHFGLDTLSWSRRGARTTGLDFSPVAVARARELALRAGLGSTFVEGDAQALPAELAGRFDLVFASYGVLCWIADIDAWMSSAAGALRSGGKLVLIDIHPLFLAFEQRDPPVLDMPYLGAEPMRFDTPGSYADLDAATSANETVSFAHGLGEIVTSAVTAGFQVDELMEWLDDDGDPRGDVLTADPDGRYRLHVGGQDLPVVFGLRATKG